MEEIEVSKWMRWVDDNKEIVNEWKWHNLYITHNGI